MDWNIKKHSLLKQIAMKNRLSVSNPMASVLINRGLSVEQAETLLDNPIALIEDPTAMYGAIDVARVLQEAIYDNKKFVVYTDYDVDGMTSGTLLHDFFVNLDCHVEIEYPERSQGYGMTVEFAEEVIAAGDKNIVVIAVDNGITAIEPIRMLKEAGHTVIVLDHHEPGAEIPNAIICDPWMDEGVGTHLCGCAVAWKVCMLVEEMLQIDCGVESMLPLVALGTVADVMPMTTENRAIVAMGLDMINKGKHKGIKKLMQACDIKKLTAKDIAWIIGPNLNACSRMGDVMAGAAVLLEDDPDVDTVLRYNKERKSLTEGAMNKAKENIGEESTDAIITFDASEYPAGILGIIAGKLAEAYGKPAAVYQQDEDSDECHASCRSVPGLSIKDIINYAANEGHAVGAAGHAEACGAVLLKSQLENFELDAENYIKACISEGTVVVENATLDIDAELSFADLTPGLIAELNLVPFGGKTDEPLFCTEEVIVESMAPFKNKEHLVLKMMDKNGKIAYALKWYGMADYMELGSPERLRVAGTPAPAKFAAKSLGLNYSDAIIDLKYISVPELNKIT